MWQCVDASRVVVVVVMVVVCVCVCVCVCDGKAGP